ncbi:F-box/LRR-repeat protein 19-like [Petromyzon marinus]
MPCSSWASTAALVGTRCALRSLDLSWTHGVRDAQLRDLLSTAPDPRPGETQPACPRLRGLLELRLRGADITDASLGELGGRTPQLRILDLAFCTHLTDAGVEALAASPAGSCLHTLCLTGCPRLSPRSLSALSPCPRLRVLDVRRCPLMDPTACTSSRSTNPKLTILH